MSSFRFEANKNGIREILCSDEVSNICRQYADRAYNSIDKKDLYDLAPRNYPERHGWGIRPNSIHGYNHNLKYNTLLKALGGGGF